MNSDAMHKMLKNIEKNGVGQLIENQLPPLFSLSLDRARPTPRGGHAAHDLPGVALRPFTISEIRP